MMKTQKRKKVTIPVVQDTESELVGGKRSEKMRITYITQTEQRNRGTSCAN